MFVGQGLGELGVELHPLSTRSHAFARQAGVLNQVEREALEAGLLSADDLRRWRAALDEADAQGIFFASVLQVMVCGRVP